jgi:hypothetical protein
MYDLMMSALSYKLLATRCKLFNSPFYSLLTIPFSNSLQDWQ